MKHKPDSLAEALDLRHDLPSFTLSFTEMGVSDNYILLSGLPEIDLCFEDHGHYILGLNLSFSSLVDYLDKRNAAIADQLKPLLKNDRHYHLLGEIFSQAGLPREILECLAGCKAKLKTYDGSSGRELPFATWNMDTQLPIFQQNELPLLILIPK